MVTNLPTCGPVAVLHACTKGPAVAGAVAATHSVAPDSAPYCPLDEPTHTSKSPSRPQIRAFVAGLYC